MSKLLQGIVLDLLARQPDFVVFTIEDGEDGTLMEAVSTHCLDVLIIAVPDAEAAKPHIELLYARPRLKVLGLNADGRSAALHYLRPETSGFSEISPGQLIAAIRSPASSQSP